MDTSLNKVLTELSSAGEQVISNIAGKIGDAKNENPDFSQLVPICDAYVQGRLKTGFPPKDIKTYLFDAAIKAVYGKDIYWLLNDVDKARSLISKAGDLE